MIPIPNPLHPALVHFPIVLILVGTAVAVAAVFVRRWHLPWLAAGLLLAGAAGAMAATWSGEEADEDAGKLSAAAEQILEEHEEWGERTRNLAIVAGLLGVGAVAAGHAVDATGDGEEAQWLLMEHSYDAAVLDIMMPGRDGVSVTRAVRAAGRSTLILLATARSDIRDRVSGLDAGADDYIVKPYSTEELLARLRALQRRSKPDLDPVLRVADLEIDLIQIIPIGTSMVATRMLKCRISSVN